VKKSLNVRREELAQARAEVLAIYQPLLDAWKLNLTTGQLDCAVLVAFEESRPYVRRFRRLRRIVQLLEWIEENPQPQPKEEEDTHG
jgi:hypothetical protein